MNVLIGCECSGVVRDAFAARGHDAMSCDLKPTEKPGKHYEGSIFDILNDGWADLFIFHPVCTYLTVTGNKWMKPEFENRFPNRKQQRKDAIEFFMNGAGANIERIAIENPVGIMSTVWREPDQIIQPYQFGHKEPKKTCLWLKNLPVLKPTCMVEPEYHDCERQESDVPDLFGGRIMKPKKRLPKWYAYADKSKGQEHRAAIRSQTFQGIADAMADQWGSVSLTPMLKLF